MGGTTAGADFGAESGDSGRGAVTSPAPPMCVPLSRATPLVVLDTAVGTSDA
jgi:hypothetical protein